MYVFMSDSIFFVEQCTAIVDKLKCFCEKVEYTSYKLILILDDLSSCPDLILMCF